MPPTPRLNLLLFGLYALVTLAILVGALVSPAVRAIAYAPLRDLLLPPPAPIELSVLYSTEKAAWITEVAARFEAARPRIEGRPVRLTLEKSGSREMYLAVLEGRARPDMISPASMLQVALLQELSTARADLFPVPVVNRYDADHCRPVLTTPVVLVGWQERAQVLWGAQPGAEMWQQLHTAVAQQNWDLYGRPEWGYIKFGQTNPLKSNSGFQTMLLMTYSYFGKTRGLTNQDVLDPAYQAWYRAFGRNVTKFGDSTGTFMQEIVAYGPSQYDFVAVYEATAIEQIENAISRYGSTQGSLQLYYPPATSLSDHPFCVLDAPWVTPEKAGAAALFLDYLTGAEAQQLALRHGFRPVDARIALDGPDSPFTRYAANGIRLDLPSQVEVPPGNVLDTLLTFWQREIKP